MDLLDDDGVVDLVERMGGEACARLRGALLGRLAEELGLEQAKAHIVSIMDSSPPPDAESPS
jgi:hypothetical protein